MMSKTTYCQVLLGIFMLAILFAAEVSFAQSDPDPTPIEVPTICNDDENVPIQLRTFKPNRMSGNVVRCIEKVVSSKGDKLIENYVKFAQYGIFYSTIIAVILFFARVMFGVVRTKGVTLMFVFKLILVLFVANPENTEMMQGWRDALIQWPQDMSVNILEAFDSPIRKDSRLVEGLPDSSPPVYIPDPLGNSTDDVFDYLDVYILKMFGVDNKELDENVKDEKQAEIYIGAAALVIGLLFTGPVGPAVAGITAGFVLVVIFAAAQAVLLFSTIIIAINFLIAIAPLAVACILFEPTKKITSTWFNYLLVYVTQPILLMAFLGMTLGILSGIVDKFADPHEKVLAKWNNVDGESVRETKLFDCSNIEVSGECNWVFR